ncbi:MAG: DUF4231 domain-containing protein [Cetobacterium sp.]
MKLNTEIVKKVNEYYTFCKVKYQAHTKAAEKYNKYYTNSTVPTIIVSTITTILASYNGIPNVQWLAIVVAIMSGITTTCQALVSFFEFKNKYQAHFDTANKYMKLLREIESDFYINYYNSALAADPILSEEYIHKFFANIHKEFMNIQSISPVLPSDISDMDFSNARFGVGEVDDVLIEVEHFGDDQQVLSPILSPVNQPVDPRLDNINPKHIVQLNN